MDDCDRINSLPDHLIAQIVSYLGIKDLIKTSVLSKRWEFVWLKASGLDLKNSDFPSKGIASTMVVEKYIEFNRGLHMQFFKVEYSCCTERTNKLLAWIVSVVDHGVEHLDVGTDYDYYIRDMPKMIYKSKTLVSLKLAKVRMVRNFFVSLPCLKNLHLENVYCKDSPLIVKKLILGCPVLEEFTLVRGNNQDYTETQPLLCVSSQTLKIFRLTFDLRVLSSVFSVEIDAPGLKYMSFRDSQSERIVVKNLSSLVKIDLGTIFNVTPNSMLWKSEDLSKRDNICDFLTSISSVRHMIISRRTVEVLYHYSNRAIPKFHNLSHLQADFSSLSLNFLPVFLESCPNLKSLILDSEPLQSELTSVPWCLTSTLEYVKIKELSLGGETWIKLGKYFLENSTIQKKLSLSFTVSPIPDKASDIIIKFLTSTKISHRCEVIVG